VEGVLGWVGGGYSRRKRGTDALLCNPEKAEWRPGRVLFRSYSASRTWHDRRILCIVVSAASSEGEVRSCVVMEGRRTNEDRKRREDRTRVKATTPNGGC
jgi:hypothetical protein